MIRDRHYILGALSVALGIISYVPYFKDMISGKTKPHIFSRLLWGIGARIVFGGQRTSGAGAGARSNLFTGGICLFFAGYAYANHGRRLITKGDWIAFGLTVLAIVCYLFTDSWLRSITFINIADALAFVPTIRKSWQAPHSETLSAYLINFLKFVFIISATEHVSFVTLSNSILWMVMHATFVVMLTLRRRMVVR